MAQVKVVLATTVAEKFVAGTSLSGYRFSVIGADPVIVVTEPLEALFDNVPAGDNTVTVQALDGAGVDLGIPVLTAFTVPEPDVSLPMPATAIVTIV